VEYIKTVVGHKFNGKFSENVHRAVNYTIMCSSRKYPYSPPTHTKTLREEIGTSCRVSFCKSKTFKEMYEA